MVSEIINSQSDEMGKNLKNTVDNDSVIEDEVIEDEEIFEETNVTSINEDINGKIPFND